MTNTTTIADLDWTKDACCDENMAAHRAWVAAEKAAPKTVKPNRPETTPFWLADFAEAAAIAPVRTLSALEREERNRMGRAMRANRNRL